MTISRQFWVVAHRWAGLTIALFLIVAGATGMLLPWQVELRMLARPALSAATPPQPGAAPLDGITLAERVERATGGQVAFVDLQVPTDHVASLSVASRTSTPLPYDTVWADPYTGEVRLKYREGVLADGPQTIMAFLYSVHRELALGRVGKVVMGLAALIWTIDCFVGFYLTLPVRRRQDLGVRSHSTMPGWWRRWRPAWAVRRRASRHQFTFDLHRAGGLWVWPLLLVFAWSGVGLNLSEVHTPAMRLFGAASEQALPKPVQPIEHPPIGLRQAKVRGENLLREIGARNGFTLTGPSWMYYDPRERFTASMPNPHWTLSAKADGPRSTSAALMGGCSGSARRSARMAQMPFQCGLTCSTCRRFSVCRTASSYRALAFSSLFFP